MRIRRQCLPHAGIQKGFIHHQPTTAGGQLLVPAPQRGGRQQGSGWIIGIHAYQHVQTCQCFLNLVHGQQHHLMATLLPGAGVLGVGRRHNAHPAGQSQGRQGLQRCLATRHRQATGTRGQAQPVTSHRVQAIIVLRETLPDRLRNARHRVTMRADAGG